MPDARLEDDERLAPIVERLNIELRGFFRTAPKLHLRVTATDSDGLLESVVSHYAHEGADVAVASEAARQRATFASALAPAASIRSASSGSTRGLLDGVGGA